jgi:hypothetical protein
MSKRLKQIDSLLHYAVDLVLWAQDEQYGSETEAIRQLRVVAL